MTDSPCWRCMNAPEPQGPARLSLCDVHILEFVRACAAGERGSYHNSEDDAA